MELCFDFGDSHEFDVEFRKTGGEELIQDVYDPLPTCIDQRGIPPLQYPPLQYPQSPDESVSDHDVWDPLDDCPHCQELKKTGVQLQWFPDEPKSVGKTDKED